LKKAQFWKFNEKKELKVKNIGKKKVFIKKLGLYNFRTKIFFFISFQITKNI